MINTELINACRENLPEMKMKINKLIAELRVAIMSADPIKLMLFAESEVNSSRTLITSEFQTSVEEALIGHFAEYVQSVMVSSSPVTQNKCDMDDFISIREKFIELQKSIHEFYFYNTASWYDKGYDEEMIQFATESQMLYGTRGKRYRCFELEYLNSLLQIHSREFERLFEITANQIIEGIQKVSYSITQGQIDEMKKLYDSWQKLSDLNETTDITENYKAMLKIATRDSFIPFDKQHNIQEITGWGEKFIQALSFEIGEDTSFFNNGEFSGWPCIDLPIQKRPFIKIENQYYCFDYFSLMDNIYRAMQKSVSRHNSDYKWSDQQQEASETTVEEIFKKILPGCKTYRNNYYPNASSKKEMNENDLIVIYSGTIIIVEIKAGSFVYTSPLLDIESHIKSYKTLVEKSDHQCSRTLDYINNCSLPTFYENDGKNAQSKLFVDKSDINNIYAISIAVDDSNSFASRAEKISFLNLRCNAISIPLGDLLVYQHDFDSPLQFLHFLSQRTMATKSKSLSLNDELDHLGMYIKHNWYSDLADETSKEANSTHFIGYREDIDQYFNCLDEPITRFEKPKQNIPFNLLQIITFLDSNDIENKEILSDYLLNMAEDARVGFSDSIDSAIKRQLEIHNYSIMTTFGKEDSCRYNCYVNQDKLILKSDNDKEIRTLMHLAHNNESDRMLIDLYYNETNKIYKIRFKLFTQADVPEDKRKTLCKLGNLFADMRFLQHKGVITFAELCPCQSGEIYERCCLGKDIKPVDGKFISKLFCEVEAEWTSTI